MKRQISEPWLIFIIGSVMFINILDFMMVMPLGPDFALALNIPTRDIGWVGGIYTFAAALSGFVCSLFLDNYDRKKALLTALFGVAVATLLCAFAWDFHSLMAARFIAGCFGGPLNAVAIAIVTDSIPAERRGAAVGKVMGSFAAASVMGVPFGLELSRLFNWQAPFVALCFIALVIFAVTIFHLPKMDKFIVHLKPAARFKILLKILRDRTSQFAFLSMGLGIMASFMLIPNISTHLQFNLDYPRENLGILYFCGGLISFFGMRYAGKFTDRYGAVKVNIVASFVFSIVILTGFIFYHNPVPVVIIFACFMLSSSARNVCAQTISSKVPAPQERAAYSALQSSAVHICSSFGAFYASLILSESADHRLVGIENVGMTSIAITMVIPFIMYQVAKSLKKRNVPEPLPVPETL